MPPGPLAADGRRRPLRVGMVCPYSLSVPGGVQAQVMGLARQLRQMGVEVRVLAPCDGPPPDTFVTPLGNSLPTSANGSVAPLAPDPSAALRTMRALKDEEFDILHLHEPYVPGPPQTAILLHPAPIVATFHAAGDSASYKYLRVPIKAAAKNVDVNVAVSKHAAELVGGYLGGRFEILYNGVEVAAFQRGSVDKAPGPVIFFCARHEERKGLDVLLAALAKLPDNVSLWIAGTGPDTERLQRQFESERRVTFLGRISDADKIARLRAATVFCAPSLHGESFGVVLIEAMAAGTAIVASGIDGYRNVATDGVDAELVPPGDVDALAMTLGSLIDDPQRREVLIANGLERAEQFSMRSLAEAYLAHYERLASERPVVAGVAFDADEVSARSPWQRMLGLLRNP